MTTLTFCQKKKKKVEMALIIGPRWMVALQLVRAGKPAQKLSSYFDGYIFIPTSIFIQNFSLID